MAKTKANGKKLTSDEQVQLCKWLAEFYTLQEVADKCQEEIGKSITRQVIHRVYLKSKKWGKLVTDLRKHFLGDFESIPISHRAVRLKRLERVSKEGLTWYISSKGKYGNIKKLELGATVSAVKEAQEIMEGHKLSGGGGSVNITVIYGHRAEQKRDNDSPVRKGRDWEAILAEPNPTEGIGLG